MMSYKRFNHLHGDWKFTVYVVNREYNKSCPENMTLQFGTYEWDFDHFSYAQLFEELLRRSKSSTVSGATFPEEISPTLCSIVKLGGGTTLQRHSPWWRMTMTFSEIVAIVEAEREQRKNSDNPLGDRVQRDNPNL